MLTVAFSESTMSRTQVQLWHNRFRVCYIILIISAILDCQHLKCWLWRLASLLWAEHKLNFGITGLRKAEKVSMMMLVLVGSPSTSKTNENIEAVKTMILKTRRITIWDVGDKVAISFGSCQAIFTDVSGMKCATSKIVPKLLNFAQKQRRMDFA